MQLLGSSTSDAEGQAALTAMSPGKCINQDVTITAMPPPEAYEPTTPTSVIFEDVDLFTPVPQQFGSARSPGSGYTRYDGCYT
jgi:hypothetical protein